MKWVKNALKTNLSLKITSLLLGFFCWFIFSSGEHSKRTLSVPICFFGDTSSKEVTHPFETVQVELSGRRSDLYHLNTETIALHVNLDELEPGSHLLDVTRENLFLPTSFKVVHLNPSNPVITVSEKVS